ncbi:MAG: SGNH/GDSL hydrolase family protein [Clostridia bacterium]
MKRKNEKENSLNIKPNLEKLFDDSGDNIWVFTGSSQMKSNFDDNLGFRSFMGHFEEFIRWELAKTSVEARQRFVFNTCENGLSLAQINQNFEQVVSCYKPKAVTFMCDKKDFSTPTKEFEKQLETFINKSIEIGAIVVLITMYDLKNQNNENLKKLNEIIKTQKSKGKFKDKIEVVDIFNLIQNKHLNENKTLNFKGHYALAQELVRNLLGCEWKIPDFNKETLISTGEKNYDYSNSTSEVSSEQTNEIKPSLINDFSNLKLLFIGDSITHGAAHTYGYDSVAQLFEKALIDIGYDKAIVLNTAVSGATATNQDNGTLHLEYKKQRLDLILATKPTHAIVMLGTNDTVVKGMTADKYERNIREIISIIKKADVVPVLRSVPPANSIRHDVNCHLDEYAKRVKKIAKDENICFIDHTNSWKTAEKSAPNLLNTNKQNLWLNDELHPNPAGQIAMFKEVFETLCGSENLLKTKIAKLTYKSTFEPKTLNKSLNKFLKLDKNSVSLNLKKLVRFSFKKYTKATLILELDDKALSMKTHDLSTNELTLDNVDTAKVKDISLILEHKHKNNIHALKLKR